MTNALCLMVAVLAGWPMFRGNPALTGTATGALPDKLKLRWTFKANAPVKSSAAIVAGKVYIGDDTGNLFAIDANTGKLVWNFKAGDGIEAAPLVLNNVVYTGSADGKLYALDAATGKTNWIYNTGGKILGSANWFGNPARIVVGSYDFKLHIVDAATGNNAWTFTTDNYINGAPAITDGKVVFGLCDGHLQTQSNAEPCRITRAIVFGGCDGKLHILGTETGEQLHEVDLGAYIPGSPALAGGRAYVGHYGSEVLCIDLATGKIVWRTKENNTPFFSSPAVTGDHVLIGGRDKKLHCYDRETGK